MCDKLTFMPPEPCHGALAGAWHGGFAKYIGVDEVGYDVSVEGESMCVRQQSDSGRPPAIQRPLAATTRQCGGSSVSSRMRPDTGDHASGRLLDFARCVLVDQVCPRRSYAS